MAAYKAAFICPPSIKDSEMYH